MKDFEHEGAIRVVGIVERFQLRAAQTGWHAGPAGDVHYFVAVVLQHVEATIRIEVQIVVAPPGEITLVLKHTLERE